MYWCMLLAYIRGLSVLAPSGMFLFMRGIHGSCWLFISHCFQAWIALFIFVSWVSVNGTGTPPSTSRDSPSDKDIFFLPHRLQAPGVMKTKYAHLPLLSYPTRSFLFSSHFIPSLCVPDILANGSCVCAWRLSGETSDKQSKWRPVAETKEHSAFFWGAAAGRTEGACMYN